MDITGKTFGRLTVLYRGKTSSSHNIYYFCKCECGTIKEISYSSLTYGCSKSCGCLRKEMRKYNSSSHGMRKTRIYNIWSGIKKRCDCKSNHAYKNYGGRGIKYDEKWKKFEGFLEDMVEGYSDSLSIDRVDNDGHYCKKNCKWSTRLEQSRNKSNTVFIVHNGERKTFYEWIDHLGLNRNRIGRRVYELGWSYERALFTKIRKWTKS